MVFFCFSLWLHLFTFFSASFSSCLFVSIDEFLYHPTFPTPPPPVFLIFFWPGGGGGVTYLFDALTLLTNCFFKRSSLITFSGCRCNQISLNSEWLAKIIFSWFLAKVCVWWKQGKTFTWQSIAVLFLINLNV